VKSLKKIQNKFIQKSILQERGIPVPRLSKEFNPKLGLPQMFKSELGGYDGKGNWVIKKKRRYSMRQTDGLRPSCGGQGVQLRLPGV
jgi:phosphoribosylaminoimidazole carboxylase (NCAIR synthetase)